MFGLGMPELVVIMFLVLLLFGAGKLPEIGSAIGKGIKGFRGAVTEREVQPEKLRDQGKGPAGVSTSGGMGQAVSK